MRKTLFFIGIVGISLVFLVFVVSCLSIGKSVKAKCQEAKKEYGRDLPVGRQDCVESLLMLLEDEKQDFRKRNSAIWALGQLGDSRALPVLQRFYTGNIPSRESLDKTISQYELQKALKLAGGGLNITAGFWRHKLNGLQE